MSLQSRECWVCDFCDHVWFAVNTSQPPQQCPKCRKRHWNTGAKNKTQIKKLKRLRRLKEALDLRDRLEARRAVKTSPALAERGDPSYAETCMTCGNMRTKEPDNSTSGIVTIPAAPGAWNAARLHCLHCGNKASVYSKKFRDLRVGTFKVKDEKAVMRLIYDTARKRLKRACNAFEPFTEEFASASGDSFDDQHKPSIGIKQKDGTWKMYEGEEFTKEYERLEKEFEAANAAFVPIKEQAQAMGLLKSSQTEVVQ